MDKANIKTTDWLTKGLTEEQIKRKKCKAIKQAERELARIEKKKGKKEMRAYHKMRRIHRKSLMKIAKNAAEWDYAYLDELVYTQIKNMYEYFDAGNNVHQTDETRLPIVAELKHVLDLYDEMYHLWDNMPSDLKYTYEREIEIHAEIYTYIAANLRGWWD